MISHVTITIVTVTVTLLYDIKKSVESFRTDNVIQHIHNMLTLCSTYIIIEDLRVKL